MKKTTVYLSDEEAANLRAQSQKTGRSQSDLIREGVRRVTSRVRTRRFRSMGVAEGNGVAVGRQAEELLKDIWQPGR